MKKPFQSINEKRHKKGEVWYLKKNENTYSVSFIIPGTLFVAVHTSISPRLPLWTNHSREWNRTDQSERNLRCYGVNRLTGHDLEGQWNRWLDFTNPI